MDILVLLPKGHKKGNCRLTASQPVFHALFHFMFSNRPYIFLMSFCHASVNIVKEMVSPFLLFSTLSFIFFKFSYIFILCFSGL